MIILLFGAHTNSTYQNLPNRPLRYGLINYVRTRLDNNYLYYVYYYILLAPLDNPIAFDISLLPYDGLQLYNNFIS